MKRQIIYILFVLSGCFQWLYGSSTKSVCINSTEQELSVDSILHHVIQLAPSYSISVGEYYADLYVKAYVQIPRKNLLMKFAPFMFKQQQGVSEYLMESYSKLHYTSPNIYDQKIQAYYGTVLDMKDFNEEMFDYIHINIYSTTLLNIKLLSPLSPIAGKYYNYRLDSLYNDNSGLSYRISFTPKNKSYQLVEGYMLISDSVWSVREFYFIGRSEYHRFDNRIRMGDVGTEEELLPLTYDLTTSLNLLGNQMNGNFIANYNYTSIKQQKISTPVKNNPYDLTESYTLQNDTTAYLTPDSSIFKQFRAIPLTDYEEKYYHQYHISKDTIQPNFSKTWNRVFWGKVDDLLISSNTIRLPQAGSIRFSELLNPFLLSYSGNNGFSYQHKIRYHYEFKGNRLIQVNPMIGYNFKYKEFYWQAPFDLDYWPRKKASLHFRIGNGNRIYGSDVLQSLKETPDSILNFDEIELGYYRDFYTDFRHRIEIINGLSIDVGFLTHCRTAIEKSVPQIRSLKNDNISKTDEIKYVSFAPRLKVSWTPKQYYYQHGDRKVNLYSRRPTFSIDYERGIKGVWGSIGEYERIEFDMQHQISLGLMRNLYYRIGTGAFTDQEDLYFVDFVNFSKNNLPTGWNDDIGGVFQLLDRRYYNASREYIRANLTYEAPFLVMPFLLKHTPNVLNERIYVGMLGTTQLHPYIELGYGIGTHIFDFGVFVNNINGKFNKAGVKLTIELFNR